jgi:hypothetical protein
MLAVGGHLILYFFLVALPLTGLALVSASVLGIPTVLYGVIPWPHLPILTTLTDKAAVQAFLKHIHAYGAWTLIAILAGHAGAALRHHFIKHDEVLLRILPRFRRSAPAAVSLVFDSESVDSGVDPCFSSAKAAFSARYARLLPTDVKRDKAQWQHHDTKSP